MLPCLSFPSCNQCPPPLTIRFKSVPLHEMPRNMNSVDSQSTPSNSLSLPDYSGIPSTPLNPNGVKFVSWDSVHPGSSPSPPKTSQGHPWVWAVFDIRHLLSLTPSSVLLLISSFWNLFLQTSTSFTNAFPCFEL